MTEFDYKVGDRIVFFSSNEYLGRGYQTGIVAELGDGICWVMADNGVRSTGGPTSTGPEGSWIVSETQDHFRVMEQDVL